MDELSPERQLLISIIRQAAKDLESNAGANYRQAKAWIQAENGFFAEICRFLETSPDYMRRRVWAAVKDKKRRKPNGVN